MSKKTLRVTILADEWKSSKGGLSTMNRELAKQLAKHPNLAVTFFVPKCTDADKKAASSHNISIVEAQEWPGFESVDCLCFPPKDLAIDIVIGHGVKLGKQAQAIKYYHHCKWVQVVHTAPEKLAMFKTYHGAISKGNKKQWTEVKLCKIADRVVAVGPKLHDIYSRYLSGIGKNVFKLTPGIFTELSDLKTSNQESKEFWVLVFGRGDSEDFELKGFDIAAKAVTNLKDESYHLIFVGAPCGNEEEVAEKLLEQGLNRNQLTVKEYLEDRDDLSTLLSTANLAVMPSRTEGFGLTGLEALSAGLPFLVSKNSGFGEALQEIPSGSSWIVESEDPVQWAEAIKGVREKGREEVLKVCQELRTRYAVKYCWEKQCNDLVEMMAPLVDASEVKPAAVVTPLQNRSLAGNAKSEGKVEEKESIASTSKCEMGQVVSFESRPEHLTGVLKDELETLPHGSVSQPEGEDVNGKAVRTSRQNNPLQEDQPATERTTVTAKHSQGARPKEMLPSITGKTKLKVSASEVEPPAVVVPLQNGTQAAADKSEQNAVKEPYSTLEGEISQAVSKESLEHLTGVLKGENVVSVMRGSQERKDQIDPSSSHASNDNPNQLGSMQPRKVHLFNCAKTCKFDAIKELLHATKAKLGFEFDCVESYFSLSQMPEMINQTIPSLHLDLAFLVVHAHESRLSMNEDNAVFGYAKIYRALLNATGENVLIVVEGDDSYRNDDEEDQFVISRCVMRKISSQFKEEFLYGRKSFIFSWDKKHRPIHEEALRHYFDPTKKGQKFEYQPKPTQEGSSKPTQSPGQKSPLHKAQSMDEQRGGNRLSIRTNSVGQKGEGSLFSSTNSAEERENFLLPRSKTVGFSGTNSVEQRREDGSPSYFNNPRNPLHKAQSMDEQRGEDRSFIRTNSVGQKGQDPLVTKSVGRKGQDSLFSSTNSVGQKGEDSLFSRANFAEERGNFLPPRSKSVAQKGKITLFSGTNSVEQRREDGSPSYFNSPRNPLHKARSMDEQKRRRQLIQWRQKC